MTENSGEPPRGENRAVRTVVAVCFGFLGALIVWLAATFNDRYIGGPSVSNDYLPLGALFIFLLLALVINPILGLCRSRWQFTSRQLVIIVGMTLAACALPGQGLLTALPSVVAGTCVKTSENRDTAKLVQESVLPQSLFPDSLEYGADTKASDRLFTGLLPGEKMQWKKWLKPLVSWFPLFFFFSLMSVGLARIVVPQWHRNEHLAFPLLEVYRPLAQAPGKGHVLSATFHQPAFWYGAGLVVAIHLFTGASAYWPGTLPTIPLSWDLAPCFTEVPWVNAPWHFYSSRIYFAYIGIAFLLTTRTSFSLWFTVFAYGIYTMIYTSYFPPFQWSILQDHCAGAALVLFLSILWLDRERWKAIARVLLKSDGTAEEQRSARSGWMFLLGMLGLAGWFIWIGVHPLWAVIFTFSGFIAAMLISRVVAETGLPLFRIFEWNASSILALSGVRFLGMATAFGASVAESLFHAGTRISQCAFATHALALEEQVEKKPSRSLGSTLAVVLAVGFVVVGAAIVFCSYKFQTNFLGDLRSGGGATLFIDGLSQRVDLWQQQGTYGTMPHNRVLHLSIGIALAAMLLKLCMTYAAWPLHPMGLLLIYSYYQIIWVSVFVGWLCKVLIVRYGGSRLYAKAKPFFLGFIFGDVFAAVFWAIFPVVMKLLGYKYLGVGGGIRP